MSRTIYEQKSDFVTSFPQRLSSQMLKALQLLLGVVAFASLLLTGCASVSPTPDKSQEKPIITVSPEVQADFDAAIVALNKEDYKGAIQLLDKVVAKSQKLAVPYINLAIAYERLGDLKQAEDNLKLALALEPDNPVAGNEYGLVYRKTGRFTEARQQYEALLKKYPHYAAAHKNLGILCDLYLRDYECALKEYEAYGKENPEEKDTKIWIADVQRRVSK